MEAGKPVFGKCFRDWEGRAGVEGLESIDSQNVVLLVYQLQ
jgi:hypothetical protein